MNRKNRCKIIRRSIRCATHSRAGKKIRRSLVVAKKGMAGPKISWQQHSVGGRSNDPIADPVDPELNIQFVMFLKWGSVDAAVFVKLLGQLMVLARSKCQT